MSDSLFGNSAASRIVAAKEARRGGFDCILGNPPWERVKLQEKEWFAERVPEIANAPNAAARGKMIKALATDRPDLYQCFQNDSRSAESRSLFIRTSRRFPFCGKGDVNLYSVFAESMRDSASMCGRVGCVVPVGIVTEELACEFLADLIDREQLSSVLGFENEEFVFPGVHHSTKFALLTLNAGGAGTEAEAIRVAFYLRQVRDIADESKIFAVDAESLVRLNPETKTIPVFRRSLDAWLSAVIYGRSTSLSHDRARGIGWSWDSCELVHMANDSGEFEDARGRQSTDATYWNSRAPLVEAKSFHAFDHRFGTYEGQTLAQAAQGKLPEIAESLKRDCARGVTYRYAVSREWLKSQLGTRASWPGMLAWRKIARNTDSRTMIASLLPQAALANSGIATFCPLDRAMVLLGMLNSLSYDYCLRQKLAGTNVSGYFTRQCAVVPVSMVDTPCSWQRSVSTASWLDARVLELCLVSDDLTQVSAALWPSGDGAVFHYDPERRFEIRCELDAAFFHLYLGTPEEWSRTASPELLKALPSPRDAIAYIMETFPIVKRKDEEAHGHYRTKDRILALYDELQRCLASGQPFQSTLSPPPGPPTNPDGSFAKLPAWPKGTPIPANWPTNLHPPISHRS